MEISEILSNQGVLSNLKSSSKKQLLQDIAEAASKRSRFEQHQIFEALLEREKLGSTGVGNGVAIPHAKIPGMDGIQGIFARLKRPVDFDAIDEEPVDIVFMLLAPEGSGADHLKALSRIARLLRDQSILSSIRKTDDTDAIYSLLTTAKSANAA